MLCGSYREMGNNEWRISFSLAENFLGQSISPVQRHVLVTLKIIKKEYLSNHARCDLYLSFEKYTFLGMLKQGGNFLKGRKLRSLFPECDGSPQGKSEKTSPASLYHDRK